MEDSLFSFEKLHVWQSAKKLALKTYKTTEGFPPKERFGLIDQIRRAAISITANIAEGNSRTSHKEKAYFIQIAYGSLMELVSHFSIAVDLEYLSENQNNELRTDMITIGRMLSGLKNSLQ
jgi:four helix bundle protein